MNIEEVVVDCFDKIIEEQSNLKNLNVMVIGKTGVGKSTLINAVFSEEMATTGQGQPITQKMALYTKPNVPLRIYDTKGLELNEQAQKEVKAEIFDTIKNQNALNDISESIHCIWYCINATSDRIEEVELEWLRAFTKENQVNNIPVIVVLTKAYSKKQSKDFANYIADQNLNVVQVIPVLALETEIDEDMFVKPYGLDVLVEVMAAVLPSEIVNTFISVQHASIEVKRRHALNIVNGTAALTFGQGFTPIPFSDAALIVPAQMLMLAKISSIFSMKLDEGTLTTLITAVLGCTGSTLAGKAIANCLKAIPGVGTALGGVISGGTASTLTKALGSAYIKLMVMFAEGKITTEDLQGDRASELFIDLYKEG